MDSFSRHSKPRLLAFTLLVALTSTSVFAQSVKPEPEQASSPTVTSGPSPTQSTAQTDPIFADPMASEWQTDGTGRTVLLNRGTKITLGPNTHAARLPMIPAALGGKDYAKSAYSVEVAEGQIDIEINPQVRPIYGIVVRAPRKVGAIIKSGTATVHVEKEAVTVAARSGKDAMAAIDEKWRPLRVGQAFTVNSNTPQGTQYPVLTPPPLTIDTPVAIAIGSSMTPQRLNWDKVPGSTAYRLRVYHYSGEQMTLDSERHLTENFHDLGPLKPGRYGATITAIDESHLESNPSSLVGFRIVEAVLPAGSLVDKNIIYLPIGERLQLLHTDALEISYGKSSDYFVPAPQSIGFIRDESIYLRLKERGSRSEAVLQLEPLVVNPSIHLGPIAATWPGAPVTISIVARRRDATKSLISDIIVPTVTINNQPVNVTWTKGNGNLYCQVDQPPYPGPWVVRVLLRDRRGRDIARDFIEVAPNSHRSKR